MDESFKKLSEEFNVDSSQETSISALDDELQDIESKKEQYLQKINTSKSITLKDQEYIDEELKTLITSSKTVLKKLEQDCKIGASARQFEVYFQGINSIASLIKELRDLNRMLFDLSIIKDDPEENEDDSKNNNFTAGQLLSLVKEAQKDKENEAIEIDFDLSEDKDD